MSKRSREWIRRMAALMFAIACNISAPLVAPFWGIPIAVVSILAWAYTLAPVEKWAKQNFRNSPLTSIACVLLLLGVLSASTLEGYTAWNKQRKPTQTTSATPPPPAPSDVNVNQQHSKDAIPSQTKATAESSSKSTPKLKQPLTPQGLIRRELIVHLLANATYAQAEKRLTELILQYQSLNPSQPKSRISEAELTWIAEHLRDERDDFAIDRKNPNDPCSGRTIFRNVSSRSNLGPGAHTIGVYIKGNPCATFDGVQNENMTEGVHMEPADKTPSKEREP